MGENQWEVTFWTIYFLSGHFPGKPIQLLEFIGL